MPTPVLLRSLLVTSVLSSPRLVSMTLPLMKRITHSKSWLLNSDGNPLLHTIVRKLLYDHFCAGENDVEVKNTIAMTKAMDYECVILGYAKEPIVRKNANGTEVARTVDAEASNEAIKSWRNGNLRTLSMLGSGDFLAVK
jgi:proline dehydrogenase